jgi:hypothetical protein
MTEDNKRLVAMEESFKGMKEDITEIKSALIGNGLSGDKGMVGKVEKLEKQVLQLTEDRIKNTVYIKQLTFVLSAVAIAVIGIIITNYFK